MRHCVALGCLLLVGCAGPHSTGALWAQQNLEQEAAFFRLSDAQRADQAQAFELSLADEVLRAERARVTAALQDCPGERRPLTISTGDVTRDTIRLRAQGDALRKGSVAQIALADWYTRRGRATGEASLCERARTALTSPPPAAPDADLLATVGEATVTRDNGAANQPALDTGDPLVALSLYATQAVDSVRAAAPLPHYLAAVYGGQIVERAVSPDLGRQPPEVLVDDLAPAYPDWEPDALYAVLSSP